MCILPRRYRFAVGAGAPMTALIVVAAVWAAVNVGFVLLLIWAVDRRQHARDASTVEALEAAHMRLWEAEMQRKEPIA